MKMHNDRFIIRVVLLVLCLVTALAGAGIAETDASGEDMQYITFALDDGLDSAACFEAYVADMFGLGASAYAQRKVGNSFTGDIRIFYDFLSECIREVAAGERTSTVFTIDHGFTLDSDGLGDLLNALLADHPAELYWFDKVSGYGISYSSSVSTFSFSVNPEYAAGEYEVDPAAVKSAQAAVDRAENIISEYASASDYEKLVGYKAAVCGLVSYNDAAAGNSGSADSNAWQLVWVFDGDDSTNVVCEGYSKAFQYLCDRTEFAGDVCCYSVTGYMATASGGGAHMWNLVRMPNDKVYLADITNCDSGAIGADDLLFMAGYDSGDAADGYVFRCDFGGGYYEDVIYAYDLEMWDIFAADDLYVSDTDYLDDDTTEAETPGNLIIDAANFPDDTFRAYVTANFDADGDGSLSDAECALAVNIDVTGQGIYSLMGIEHFTSLERLYCADNKLASLDVSGNGALIELDCGGNLLSSLDISQNTLLERLDCSDNSLSRLNVYSNTALKDLSMNGNDIAEFYIRDNPYLFTAITEGECRQYSGYVVYTGEKGRFQVDSNVELWVETCTEHFPVVDEAVAPTCTAAGLTEGSHCIGCGEVLASRETVPALGHTEVTDAAAAPTCTATGLTEGKHCSVCSEVLTAQEVVPALGHTEVIDEAVAPTCTATGLTEGKHCSVCSEVLTVQNVVPALGHTEVKDAAAAPTCTATGMTEGKHCSVCNEVLTAQEVVPATGHTEAVSPAKAPDCTEDGCSEGKHCSVCNEVLVAQDIIPAKGHEISVKEEIYELNAGETMTAPKITFECGHSKISVKWQSSHEDRLAVSGTKFTAKAAGAVTLTAMTDDAFKTACSLTVVVHGKSLMILPAALTAIEDDAFKASGAQEYVLPENLTAIGSRAFEGCGDLRLVNIPDSVTFIGEDAFRNCPQLTLLCAEGSYGHKYAEANGIPCVVIG